MLPQAVLTAFYRLPNKSLLFLSLKHMTPRIILRTLPHLPPRRIPVSHQVFSPNQIGIPLSRKKRLRKTRNMLRRRNQSRPQEKMGPIISLRKILTIIFSHLTRAMNILKMKRRLSNSHKRQRERVDFKGFLMNS
ncbi:hypothetical protein I309_04546 [Cryptococcus deuterogattii LA55]|nr:hypothetical protein I309_04546 [Cryptococcus deuterogattii LA55]KIR33113.1 hypothetical protein I352_04482 [Cryptococcus deuterogattii MMRL2647]KIR91959.1 hypothetical protein I304_04123 [Cryptococcus deuterogattii CBS 10090]